MSQKPVEYYNIVLDVLSSSDSTGPTFATYTDGQRVEITHYETSSSFDTSETCTDDHILAINAVADGAITFGNPGTYPITYTCADYFGNESQITVNFVVLGTIIDESLPSAPSGGRDNGAASGTVYYNANYNTFNLHLRVFGGFAADSTPILFAMQDGNVITFDANPEKSGT